MRLFRDNGLSIVLGVLFVAFLGGQFAAGHRVYNDEQRQHGQPAVAAIEYVRSAHFLEATAENWESEFLQMAVYVLFTVFLFQRGSAESKDPDKSDEVDREPRTRRKDAPWPVRRGGLVLRIYSHSLTLAFALLFVGSFVVHAVAGARHYSGEQVAHGRPSVTLGAYLATSQFWFESFQNWQSEFLAIAAMVVLSIFLRQKGSPESKPVDRPHRQTGG